MILRVAIASALWLAMAASSAALELDLPGENARQSVDYTCADGIDRTVEYVGAGENDLALLDIDDERRLFVAVLAASGVRYVSGPLVWWTKGDEATLHDERRPGEDPIACRDKETAR